MDSGRRSLAAALASSCSALDLRVTRVTLEPGMGTEHSRASPDPCATCALTLPWWHCHPGMSPMDGFAKHPEPSGESVVAKEPCPAGAGVEPHSLGWCCGDTGGL